MKWILKQLARFTLWKFEPKVIVVPRGADGAKIKNMARAILKEKRVRASGVPLKGGLDIPLTILGNFDDEDLRLLNEEKLTTIEKLKNAIFWGKIAIFGLVWFFKRADYPSILILEYGTNIYHPYVGVAMAAVDSSLPIERLPGNGFAVLNFDDEAVLRLKEKTRARIITFGFKDGADLRIVNFGNGASFKLSYGGSVVPVAVKNALSREDVCAAAAAACVGLIFDLNLVEIAEGLEEALIV